MVAFVLCLIYVTASGSVTTLAVLSCGTTITSNGYKRFTRSSFNLMGTEKWFTRAAR